MGKLDGKVALVTGAARGIGRAYALALAKEGAKIIAVDLCAQINTVPYPMSDRNDLDGTVAQIRAEHGEVVKYIADVRHIHQLREAIQDGMDNLGKRQLDIVCANAGILSFGSSWEMHEDQWRDVIDVNLTGVWHTVKAAVPEMQKKGGSIVITNSVDGLHGMPGAAHYVAAKHGLTGLMRSLANELGQYNIRVNAINPFFTNTPMTMNDAVYQFTCPGSPTQADFLKAAAQYVILPNANPAGSYPCVEPDDVAHAMLWLVSDAARYVTGISLPVDVGYLEKVMRPSAAPGATHGTDQPLYGEIKKNSGGITRLDVDTGAATVDFTVDDLSPLGAVTGHDVLTVTPTGNTFSYRGTTTFVANGDELFSTVTGSGTITPTGTAQTRHTGTITGGTGRFAGARGTYTDTASHDPVSVYGPIQIFGLATAVFRGEISY